MEEKRKFEYGARKLSAKQALLSPAGCFGMLISAFFIIWFLRSFVMAVRSVGFSGALWGNLPSLAALFVCCFLFIWPALHDGKKKTEGENVLRVGESTVVMIRKGKKDTFFRAEIVSVALHESRRGFLLSFTLSNGGEELFPDLLPVVALIPLSRIFGAYLKREKLAEQPRERKVDRGKIWFTAFLSLPVWAGIAVLALSLNGWNIPVILGVFFLLSGCGMVCIPFSLIPLVKNCVMPLFMGAVFAVTPLGFAAELAAHESQSLSDLFAGFPFTPLNCAVVMLTAVGILGILQACGNAFRHGYVRYLKSKQGAEV